MTPVEIIDATLDLYKTKQVHRGWLNNIDNSAYCIIGAVNRVISDQDSSETVNAYCDALLALAETCNCDPSSSELSNQLAEVNDTIVAPEGSTLLARKRRMNRWLRAARALLEAK